MISKVFSGHSFDGACQYVCSKQGARILETAGVRGHRYDVMADDFKFQQGMHPAKKKACFHGILSFYPGEGERIGEEKMLEIAKKYLEEIGIKNTQYAIAKHTDRAHLHLHIIANLVDNNGKVINDGWMGLKGKKIAQQLTEAYGLVPADKKNLELTHLEALNQSEANRYKIYEAIRNNLPDCRTIEALEERLKKQGITTIYKYKGQTNEKQGVSFQIEKDCFKGSKIDRKFSLGNLEKHFALRQQNLYQIQQKSTKYHISNENYNNYSQKFNSDNIGAGKEISGLVDSMIKPDLDFNLPYNEEYNNEPKKKKRKKKYRGWQR
ncbi:MAG: relaxase/mobilization nuclease domain-containing protein [Chitinophagaceae bacterium]